MSCGKLINGNDTGPQSSSGLPRILLVNLVGQGFGGLETHVLNLYQQLSARGHYPLFLVAANSPLHQRIQQEGLSCYAVRGHKLRGFRHLFPFIFTRLCKRHHIVAIHCNNRFEIPSAVRAAKKCNARVIFNYHVPDPFDTNILEGVDAVVSPGRDIMRFIAGENRARNLGIKHTRVIPPLFNADKFLNYQSDARPGDWFASTFGVTLKPCPVICTIGNMVPDLQHKNYPLLFEAVASLIHHQKTPVQVALVGDGPVRSFLEELVGTLNIGDYVHFLGHTTEHTPGVLYHSNLFVLASSKEAFGIVFLEAGLMRKPAIGARNTGAELMIVPDKTGLLFENGKADSLADAIKRLAGNPNWARELGQQAYEHVSRFYAPSVLIEQYEELYAVRSPCDDREQATATEVS